MQERIALETFIGSFVVIWFGLGFIITAGISYFYEFSDGIWEIATVSIISLLLPTLKFGTHSIIFSFILHLFQYNISIIKTSLVS